jgi:Fe-S-cluster containining protein
MSKGKNFYKNGIRFRCRGEGKCCMSRGEYGYVYLSFNDRKRLARYFGISVDEFTARYTIREEGCYQLIYRDKDCPFLEKNRCTVYEARPWQCRTWPFWPENMESGVWEQEIAPYCPGVGSGRLYTAQEIENILTKKLDVSGCAFHEDVKPETDVEEAN